LRTFLIFLFSYLLSQFFRSFLAVIAPELAVDLNLTAAQLGSISAAWFAAFAVAQFPVGWALDRFGPRRTVPLIMTAAVAGSLVFAGSSSSMECHVAMALIGLGCSPIYMGALFIFGRVFPANRFALLSSWLLGVGSCGNLLAATPLAYAAQTYGWRTTFVWIAALTVAAIVSTFALIKDPPRVTSPITGKTLGLLAGIHEIVRLKPLWLLLPMIAVSYAVVAAERGLWAGPYFADVHGLGPVERGNAVLVMAIAMSLGALIYGPLDLLLRARKWLIAGGTLVSAAALGALAIWPAPSTTAAIAMVSLLGLTGSTYGLLMAHGRSFFPEHLLGRGMTLLNFLFIGGVVFLQLISGATVDTMRGQGASAAQIYATLHFGFAVALLVATCIYAFSREQKDTAPSNTVSVAGATDGNAAAKRQSSDT
jgi:predicted MFS family arabinose efflux permease